MLAVVGGLVALIVLSGLGKQLVIALRPLTLPLLVLVLVGAARALPPALAGGAVVLGLLFAYFYVIRPEWDEITLGFAALGRRIARRDRRAGDPSSLAWLGARTVVFPLLLVTVAASPSTWMGGRGGTARGFAEGALVVTGIALLARLTSFATTPPRALSAFGIWLLATRAFMRAGFLPGDAFLNEHAPGLSVGNIALGVAGVLVGCAAVEVARHRRVRWRALRLLNRRLLPRRISAAAATGGLVACIVAAAALGVAVVLGIYTISNQGGEDPRFARPSVPLASLPRGDLLRPGNLAPEQLARTYMPVLVYAGGQRWLPDAVRSYLDGAKLVFPDGTQGSSPNTPAELPQSCGADVAPPCFSLTIECGHADLPCAGGRELVESDRIQRRGTVYVRVLRTDLPARAVRLDLDPRRREADAVLEYTGPFEEPIHTLLQYWLFYRYDEWAAPTLFGRLVQRHEADWEAITIGFSETEPLFVAYSAHCGGRWLPWRDVEVAADAPLPTHPLVAVAEGSHANYDASQSRRPPDWASCLGVDGSAFAALTYVWGIEDVTGNHVRVMPGNVVLVDRRTAPMTFPGTWGGNDYTALANQRAFRLGEPGRGPRTPSLQALWVDPITTIFCSSQWRPRRCDGVRPRQQRRLIAALEDEGA